MITNQALKTVETKPDHSQFKYINLYVPGYRRKRRWPILVSLQVNINVNLYSALSHSASNALNAPNTAETNASLTGNRSWRC